MKKRTFKEKMQYRFDNLMSKGTAALIGLLFGITMIVVGIMGILAVIAGGEGGVGSQIWISLMHALDAGTLAGDSLDNIPYIIMMSIVTLCGLFITSILIGIITTGFEDKLNQLRKGTSKVLEENHTVILGFNENIYTLLEALIEANANQKDACIVVVGEEEKEVMEEEIAAHITDTKTTRIICRSGSLYEPHILERCSLECCRSILINVYEDAQTIKTILSVSTYLDERKPENANLFMTAVIMEEQNVDAAKLAGNGRAEVIFAQNAISRIIANTCREPGLSRVMVELFDYDGDELYYEDVSAMYGKKFKETLLAFPKSVVFGLYKNGITYLNPPMDTMVENGDKLILLEEDDGSFKVQENSGFDEEMICSAAVTEQKKDSLLVLGYNEKLETILTEYDCYVKKGTAVTIIYPEKLELNEQNYQNILLSQKCEKNTSRIVLGENVTDNCNVLILSNNQVDAETSDADTLLQLIFLRDISQKTGKNFTITSEMKKSTNQRLASPAKVEDFVIGSNIVNLLMTQIAENRSLTALFEDILDEDGSEIYMKPAAQYVKLHTPVDFYTVTESAARKGQIAVGYKKMTDGQMEIVTNPLKSDKVVYGEKDYLIVITED